MTNAQAFAIFAALALSSTPDASAQKQAANSADTIDTVEVTAQREAKRKAIHTYVANVTRFEGENVARWRYPICPVVAGVAAEHAKFMRARIVEIAESVGAPLHRDQEKCSPNLTVVLTTEPQAHAPPPPHAKLTEFDWSFLKTLCGVDITIKRPRSLLTTTMVNGLVPEPR